MLDFFRKYGIWIKIIFLIVLVFILKLLFKTENVERDDGLLEKAYKLEEKIKQDKDKLREIQDKDKDFDHSELEDKVEKQSDKTEELKDELDNVGEEDEFKDGEEAADYLDDFVNNDD